MQLVQIGKMIKENSKQFNENKIESPYRIECTASYCGSVKGYVLVVKLDDVVFKISSQREEHRVFKSVDSLIKNLRSIDIFNLTVCFGSDSKYTQQ